MRENARYDRKVVETAMAAGEIMLLSGSEISRVEDTMNRILNMAHSSTHTAFVLTTGLMLTLDGQEELITVSRRVPERSTNLHRIYLVNNVSRDLSNGKIDIDRAYWELGRIKNILQFTVFSRCLAYVGAALFFTMLLGGKGIDCLLAGVMGGAIALIQYSICGFGFNSFFLNGISAMVVAMIGIVFKKYILPDIEIDSIIIGGIMPLVPGVIFTTAIRDTLNGDYHSGMSRILEAIVVALAIAVGVAMAYVIL